MDDSQHTQVIVYREVPGIVAALYDARVDDAWRLMDASEIDPRLLLVDVWKYLHLGWQSILSEIGEPVDPAALRDFWISQAQQSQHTITRRPDGPRSS